MALQSIEGVVPVEEDQEVGHTTELTTLLTLLTHFSWQFYLHYSLYSLLTLTTLPQMLDTRIAECERLEEEVAGFLSGDRYKPLKIC
jgi:hypothetical protein